MARDTQWPRFEVFLQDRPGRPHKNVGSVHAPDEEIAMQNARDVFVRRPRCHSLWVAPADAILARTREELEAEAVTPAEAGKTTGRPYQSYLVFQKSDQRQSMEFVSYVGEVEAASADEALARAVERFGDAKAYVWWVLPQRAVVRSAEEDVESMFSPAESKTYKQPREFRTVTMMKQVRAGRQGEE